MILTKDNLLRYIRERKAVTPTTVAEAFETTTMIASAALSELAKEKLIAITHLKLSSSPYYYDLKQKDYLIELGEKHFSKHDKDIFEKLRQHQILNANSLNIQEGLAIERIKDFAIPLDIEYSGKEIRFWVWYLRDIDETRNQIYEAIKDPSLKSQKGQQSKEPAKPKPTEKIAQEVNAQISSQQNPQPSTQTHQHAPKQQVRPQGQSQSRQEDNSQNQRAATHQFNGQTPEEHLNKEEMFVENFFRQNYLNIESKNKSDKNIKYDLSININRIKIFFDCIYYNKKPNEAEIMKFYTSSLKPKIIFIQNAPKKLLKLSDTFENLTIINI